MSFNSIFPMYPGLGLVVTIGILPHIVALPGTVKILSRSTIEILVSEGIDLLKLPSRRSLQIDSYLFMFRRSDDINPSFQISSSEAVLPGHVKSL